MAELDFDFEELERTLGPVATPSNVRKTLLAIGRRTVAIRVRVVTREKLRGSYLNRITGNLIRTVTQSPTSRIRGNTIESAYGTSSRYGRAHELGFDDDVAVPSHQRPATRVQAFERNGRPVRAHDRASYTVRAHNRRMNLRARYFFRDTDAEDAANLRRRTTNGLAFLAQNGRPPRLGEVRP